MTSTEIQELLKWARENKVVAIKADGIECAFLPLEPVSPQIPQSRGPSDTLSRVDLQMFGHSLEKDRI